MQRPAAELGRPVPVLCSRRRRSERQSSPKCLDVHLRSDVDSAPATYPNINFIAAECTRIATAFAAAIVFPLRRCRHHRRYSVSSAVDFGASVEYN